MLQWKIGDVTVTQLIEITDGSGSVPILPDATPENLAQIPWLKPNFVTPEGNLILNIQMMIIETPEQKMVVDTCIGNDKALNMEGWANLQLPFLDDLKSLGHDPASVAQGRGQVGADIPERALRHGRERVRILA